MRMSEAPPLAWQDRGRGRLQRRPAERHPLEKHWRRRDRGLVHERHNLCRLCGCRKRALAWQIAGVGNFNAGSQVDILWRNTATGEVGVWYMNGITNRAMWMSEARLLPGRSPVSATSTRRPDRHPLEHTSTGEVAVWYMNGITF